MANRKYAVSFSVDSGETRKRYDVWRNNLMIVRGWLGAVIVVCMVACTTHADVNLELRPANGDVRVGGVLEVGLYAVSDDESDQMVRGMQVILQWDPAYLELDEVQPLIHNGPYSWLMSGFYDDDAADGVNNTWADGNAYYQATGNFVAPAWATPEGLLVTTLRFNAVGYVPETSVTIPPEFGLYTASQVFGEVVAQDVVGTLGLATVSVGPEVDWGMLSIEVEDDVCGVFPGDSITILLLVSDLIEPINGVQALIEFDPNVLAYVQAAAGDGGGSPWDSAIVTSQSVDGSVLQFSTILFGDQSDVDATVARLEFLYQPIVPHDDVIIQLLSQQPPLLTKLTDASTALTVIPGLGPAIQLFSMGDSNGDGAVDLGDMEDFVTCMSGPGSSYPGTVACCRADFDGDGDVDLRDFGVLQALLGE